MIKEKLLDWFWWLYSWLPKWRNGDEDVWEDYWSDSFVVMDCMTLDKDDIEAIYGKAMETIPGLVVSNKIRVVDKDKWKPDDERMVTIPHDKPFSIVMTIDKTDANKSTVNCYLDGKLVE
jgi:hypothetical protein